MISNLVKMGVREEITMHLKNNKRSLRWLASECGVNYNTMYSTVRLGTIGLSKERLGLINKVLKTKFKLDAIQ